ncbi:MAG TPA: Rieske 2Fe-2S domain-containing protein [Chloroflexota bacterium]|nr:Rieske 2Fe-2S domain-containing protein [Chloroflexota bacterium]
MLPTELNDLITKTDPGTPGGNLLRRYWLPALLSEEIPEPDSPPAQVRIMGEELVAFRDSNGRIGLLEEHCLHRGTSLFYGRNEECGLRCIYHGWKYDVDGNVLDTPAEPADSNFKNKLKHVSYPVVETGGIIWAYLGPKDKQPPFPHFYWSDLPASHCYVTKCWQECNYLQGLEGESDSSHLSFLHREFSMEGEQRLYAFDSAPAYEIEETDFGLRMVATRKGPESTSYVRVSSFVMPSGCFIPALNKEYHLYVPADDTHSWRYDLGWFEDREARPEDVNRKPEIGPDYRRLRTQANHYLQDRDVQRTRTFTGIQNFLNHDSCATETMGPRYDRSREHLGVSDKAVIAVRRRLIDAAQALECGEEPPMPHVGDDVLTHIDTRTDLVPPGVHWREHWPDLVNHLKPVATTTA